MVNLQEVVHMAALAFSLLWLMLPYFSKEDGTMIISRCTVYRNDVKMWDCNGQQSWQSLLASSADTVFLSVCLDSCLVCHRAEMSSTTASDLRERGHIWGKKKIGLLWKSFKKNKSCRNKERSEKYPDCTILNLKKYSLKLDGTTP